MKTHWPERLNQDCVCLTLDDEALARALDAELGESGLPDLVRERCPFVFAAQPVFLSAAHVRSMAEVVRAIESVVAMPAYREEVLGAAPEIARTAAAGAEGVFLGYDFHLDGGPPRLIEINTNAGGALLNVVLARAQRSCCAEMDAMMPGPPGIDAFEQRIVDMFRREWSLSGMGRPLVTVAIVDEDPAAQYLYPEFLLFRTLFERQGWRALIADPGQFEHRGGRLWCGDVAIDLVYNRLTDFYLEHPGSQALRRAWVARDVVLTPHPQAHALRSDKRLLALFSDDQRLARLGVDEPTRTLLQQTVPRTEVVTAGAADRLWAERRGLFFKPMAGYGGRAAYRGEKLTRRVWQEILAGGYVAQELVRPGERWTEADGSGAMKYDLRAYAYAGEIQWLAARMYQGQVTNFRTPGGGFAPVYSTVDAGGRALDPQPA